MKKPQTMAGWAGLIVSVLSIVSVLGGGLWSLHRANAYASDVQALEQMVASGLKSVVEEQDSKRCTAWLSEITLLEAREASGDLTPAQRDRLIWLRRQYDDQCGGGS